MKQLLMCLLGLSLSGSAFANPVVEDIWCISTSFDQYFPKDQPAQAEKVSYHEVSATREMRMDGQTQVFKTSGRTLDRAGDTISTYSSNRRTDIVQLSETRFQEVSIVETETTRSDNAVSQTKYQMTLTYERQMDGTKKLVEQVVDGKVVEQNDTAFSIIDRNGVEYSSYFTDQPQEFQFEDGSVFKVNLSKQICTTTKK